MMQDAASGHRTRVKCSYELEVDGEQSLGVSERTYPANMCEADNITIFAAPIVHALRASESQVVLVLAEALIQALSPDSLDDIESTMHLDEREAKLLAVVTDYRKSVLLEEKSEV